MTVADIAGSTDDALKEAIAGVLTDLEEEETTNLANHIHSVATNLHTRDGGQPFPTTLVELLGYGVDEHVARSLMQHVYGATDIVIGLHTRKMVCALDLFDWEETGYEKKCNVKLKYVTASQVKKSIRTWIPKGQGKAFQDTMESLGAVLGRNEKGFWGGLTRVLNKRFSTKDKQALLKMVEDVICFYKATRSGGKKKCNL